MKSQAVSDLLIRPLVPLGDKAEALPLAVFNPIKGANCKILIIIGVSGMAANSNDWLIVIPRYEGSDFGTKKTAQNSKPVKKTGFINLYHEQQVLLRLYSH